MLYHQVALALLLASCVASLPSSTTSITKNTAATLKKRQADEFDQNQIAEFDDMESVMPNSGGAGSSNDFDFTSFFDNLADNNFGTTGSSADDFSDLFSDGANQPSGLEDIAEDLGLGSNDVQGADALGDLGDIVDNWDELPDPLPDLSEDLGLDLDNLEDSDLGNDDPRGGGRPRPRPNHGNDQEDEYERGEEDDRQTRPRYNRNNAPRQQERPRYNGPSRGNTQNRRPPPPPPSRYNGPPRGNTQQQGGQNNANYNRGGQGGGSCNQNGAFACEGSAGFVQCNRGLWDYHACPANTRCQVMSGQVYCVPGTGSGSGATCNQNGVARCTNGGYDVCTSGRWQNHKCGTGQQCRLYNGEVFCDYPLNGGQPSSGGGGNQSGGGAQCQANTMACNGSGYDTCVSGKWKYNACASGTACKIASGKLYCAPSQANNNVQQQAWNGQTTAASTPVAAPTTAAALPYFMMPSTTITIIPPPPPAPIIITTGGGMMMGNPSAMSMPVQYMGGNVQQQSLPVTYTGGVQSQANTVAPPPTYANNVNSKATTPPPATKPTYNNGNTNNGIRQQSNSPNPRESWDTDNQPFDLDEPGFFNQLSRDNRPFTGANGDGIDRDMTPAQDSNNWNLNGTPDQMLDGVDTNQNGIQDFSQDASWNNNNINDWNGGTSASSNIEDQITQFNMFDNVGDQGSSMEFGGNQVVSGSEPSNMDDLLSSMGGRQVVNQNTPFSGGSF